MTMSLSTPRSGHRQTAIEHRSARGLGAMRVLGLLCGLFVLGGCDAAQPGASAAPTAAAAATAQPEESRMWMTVGERRFAITLADTEAARAFAGMLPLTIDMPDLNSNEKHAQLPKALPTNESRPGVIRNGDLMLYGSTTLVVFYKTFPSAYLHTRASAAWMLPMAWPRRFRQRSARITFSKNWIGEAMQALSMQKPYVIIHTLTSLDGRTTTSNCLSSILRRFSTSNWRCTPISKS